MQVISGKVYLSTCSKASSPSLTSIPLLGVCWAQHSCLVGVKVPAPKICFLLVASFMMLPSVYVIDFLFMYFGNMRALVLVDVCIMNYEAFATG
jgi:hypothetical protein